MNCSVSPTRKDVKQKFMLKLKCYLLSLSVHLLQWFSASSPSSTPLWTTLSKFTMGRLSIPVFSAPSPVHTQVHIHKISFWCHLLVSNCLYCNHCQTWFEDLSPRGLNFGFGGRGGCHVPRLHLHPLNSEKKTFKCCCLNSTFTSLYFYLRKSLFKFKIVYEAFPPNIVEYGSKEPKYCGNTVHITAQINGNKWHRCDRQKIQGLLKLSECRAVVHLYLPQLSKAEMKAWQKQNDDFGLCPGRP